MITWLALAAATISSGADLRMSHITSLYEQLCLKTFPDDQSIAERAVELKAQEMTPDQVKVTMVNDPARGWFLLGLDASLWLEFPPYHACSMRWNSPQIDNIDEYRVRAKLY